MSKNLSSYELMPPSCGIIQLCRSQGHRTLYGSPFNHEGFITLTIHRAEEKRDLSRISRFSSIKNGYIKVAMSYSQFAQAITSMNVRDGIPCTVDRLLDTDFDPPLREDESADFARETKETIESSLKAIDKSIADLEQVKLSAKDKELLRGSLQRAKQQLTSNLDFVVESYREYLGNVTQQAKTEIVAYRDMVLTQAGMDALEAQQILGLPADRDRQ